MTKGSSRSRVVGLPRPSRDRGAGSARHDGSHSARSWGFPLQHMESLPESSSRTIHNCELRKGRRKPEQLQGLVSVRALGKREVAELLSTK